MWEVWFIGLSRQVEKGINPLISGYEARTWLPGYDEQTFVNEADAYAWVEGNRIDMRADDVFAIVEV